MRDLPHLGRCSRVLEVMALAKLCVAEKRRQRTAAIPSARSQPPGCHCAISDPAALLHGIGAFASINFPEHS
jgi:hypothetical protein